MTKKRRFAMSGVLYVAGALVAVYGAGLSWRQVLLGGVALLVWQFADETFKAAYTKPAFQRYQFRLGIEIGLALERSGLYSNEWEDAVVAVAEGMLGRGWITFTWLEPDLFYINTTHQFSSQLEVAIDLPSFGSRIPERFQLSDMIEMRGTKDGYELVLLTREQRYSWPETTRGKGLVLFYLPYKFLWSLQGDSFESHKVTKEVLTACGFAYHSDAEVSEAWHYRNEYGSLKWWDV